MLRVESKVDEIPGSVRIRCGTENVKRYRATTAYNISQINRTDAIVRAVRYFNRMHSVETAEVVSELMHAAEERGSLRALEITKVTNA